MANSPKDSNSSFPLEFTVRVACVLYSFIEGVIGLMDKDDSLGLKLKSFGEVIQKSARVKPFEGFALEVRSYFEKVKMTREIAQAEQEGVKAMFIDLAKSLKGMSDVSGVFYNNIGGYVEKVESASTLTDIIKCKNDIIQNMEEMRSECKKMKSELETLHGEVGGLSRKLQESESQVHIDALTKAYNRSAYEIKISQVIRNFKQNNDSATLFIIDIDYFKKINDTYGHKAGDEILKSVSDTLRKSLRETDLLFRYGGEEFVIILEKIGPEKAVQLAEKLRTVIEKDYLVYKNKKIQVTISIGIACLNEGDEEQSFFENADKALYEAKGSGRNRVVIADKDITDKNSG